MSPPTMLLCASCHYLSSVLEISVQGAFPARPPQHSPPTSGHLKNMDLCLYRTSLVTQDKIYWHIAHPLVSSYWELLLVLKHRCRCPGIPNQHLCCFCTLPTCCQFFNNCLAAQVPLRHRPWGPEYLTAFLLHLCCCRLSGKGFKEDPRILDSLFLKEAAL